MRADDEAIHMRENKPEGGLLSRKKTNPIIFGLE